MAHTIAIGYILIAIVFLIMSIYIADLIRKKRQVGKYPKGPNAWWRKPEKNGKDRWMQRVDPKINQGIDLDDF